MQMGEQLPAMYDPLALSHVHFALVHGFLLGV